jgi:hypothetical protein
VVTGNKQQKVSDPFDFMEETHVILPTGGSGLVSRGLIAPWTASVVYTAMTQEDYNDTFQSTGVKFEAVPTGNGWTKFYFPSYEEAQSAAEACGNNKFTPNQQWYLSCRTKDVVNADVDKLEHGSTGKGWGARITYEVPILSLVSGNRHPFHMILLPSLVRAAAVLKGWQVPELDWSDIANARDYIPSDDDQARLIGHPDAKSADDERHYTHSVLWEQRAMLWRALGEEDSTVYLRKGATNARGKPDKFTTTSDKLDFALSVLMNKWAKPVWCRVATVADPAMKNKMKNSGKPGQVPIILDMWGGGEDAEANAREIGASELAGREDEGGGASVTSGNGSGPSLKVPVAWEGQEEDWRKLFATEVGGGKGLKEAAAELDATDLTVAQLNAWKKELGL